MSISLFFLAKLTGSIFVPDKCVLWLPGLVNVFVAPVQKLFCGNLVSLLCRAFFFSVGIIKKAGGFEFGCVGCCLVVGSAMSRKVLFVRWPPDFSIT